MKRAQVAFESFIRDKGLKLTRQRAAILDAVLHAKGHFTADELFERMRKDRSGTGKATIYRTLDLLADGGFLEAHHFGQGSTVYEKIVGRSHHDHMVCVQCGRVLEFQCPEIEKLQEREARKHGFQMISHSLNFFGYCSVCSKRRKKT